MINVADILNDTPYRTLLYSTIDGDCYFNHVDNTTGLIYLDVYTEDCVICRILDKYGRLSSDSGCIVFPSKEIQDWTSYQHEDNIEELKDELDVLNMRYLSQVSMWKSLYEETKRCIDEKDKQFLEYLDKKRKEFEAAYSNAYRKKMSQQVQDIYRKYAGIYNKEQICEWNRQCVARGEITVEDYNEWVKYNIKERPNLYSENDLIKTEDNAGKL